MRQLRTAGILGPLVVFTLIAISENTLHAQNPLIRRLPPIDAADVPPPLRMPGGAVRGQSFPAPSEFDLERSQSEQYADGDNNLVMQEAFRTTPPLNEPLLKTWWDDTLSLPLRSESRLHRVSLESLIIAALQHSPRVQAISDQSIIRKQTIVEADAAFDVVGFMESRFDRASDPVGNQLTVGPGGTRFRQEDWQYSAGLRKKTRIGGNVEASQKIGILNNNSQFLSPRQQGNSRLTLSYTQPLLNGAGRTYNESLIVLADLDTQAADGRTSEELQAHLLAVAESYWELYMHRASFVQKQRHHDRARKILDELEAREGVDALRSQIVRARSAVATRSAELIRAATMVRNAEARIRALVASPDMIGDRQAELVPMDIPAFAKFEVDERFALTTALENRPELDQAMHQIKAATVRLQMSKQELLPVLDAVLETYVSGLDGNYGIDQAWANQFTVGEPGYSAGLLFEVPLYNRAAIARHKRRQLELRQLTSQFQDTIESLSAEVEIAVREVKTAYREMQARHVAMDAAIADMDYLQERWQHLPGEDRAASFLLEDLLDAQDRLADEEFRFANAQRAYTFSLTALKRATGTLLQEEQIANGQAYADQLPRLVFEKSPTHQQSESQNRGLESLP